MIVKITSQFAVDFKEIDDDTLKEKIKSVLATIKSCDDVSEIPHFRKIKGNDNAYKMGIGFYFLVGVTTSTTEITLMRFLHRDRIRIATQKI